MRCTCEWAWATLPLASGASRPDCGAGPTQVLVAERAGQWNDALALYESAVRRETTVADTAGSAGGLAARSLSALRSGGRCGGAAGGLSSSGGIGGRAGTGLSVPQTGSVRCMMAMGHWQVRGVEWRGGWPGWTC